MPGPLLETLAVLALAAALLVAIVRPFGLPEAVFAVPAAGVLVLVGAVSGHVALDRVKVIGPTVVFLSGILIFGRLCADAGVFDYLGSLMARTSRPDPRRLLLVVVIVAALVTAVLTLDATVVLLTPVVLATVSRMGVGVGAASYACVRLANSGSLLLPVSNLTNLLAFGSSGLSFGRFAALMALPWLVVCALEWLTLRTAFRAELGQPAGSSTDAPTRDAPRYALAVLAITVAGFVITSSVHVNPAYAAFGGCVLLIAARPRAVSPRSLVSAASPGFCFFVLALAVIVEAVSRHGLGSAVAHLVPSGAGLLALLGMAFVAAVLANLVNNLPATLLLVPLVAGQPALALAMLLGVNIGPNAAYPGSLATLLWRRLLPADVKPDARRFHVLGLVSTPVVLAVATLALWGAAEAIGY